MEGIRVGARVGAGESLNGPVRLVLAPQTPGLVPDPAGASSRGEGGGPALVGVPDTA